MSLLAQMTFFTAGFANLHQLVLHQLADARTGSRHPVLPLLHVSRYWRAFAREFLLEPYQTTKVDPKSYVKDPKRGYSIDPILTDGAYVKFALHYWNPYDDAHESDDPRFLFTKEGSNRPTIYLLINSCDPATLLCTFLAADADENEFSPFAECTTRLVCNPETGSSYGDIPAPGFSITPSTWFVKESKRGAGVWGQDVAFAPGMYPSVEPFIQCPDSELPGEGQAVEPNEKKDFGVLREDSMKDAKAAKKKKQTSYEAPLTVMMRSAKIPLAGLYQPTELHKEKPYGPDHY